MWKWYFILLPKPSCSCAFSVLIYIPTYSFILKNVFYYSLYISLTRVSIVYVKKLRHSGGLGQLFLYIYILLCFELYVWPDEKGNCSHNKLIRSMHLFMDDTLPCLMSGKILTNRSEQRMAEVVHVAAIYWRVFRATNFTVGK